MMVYIYIYVFGIARDRQLKGRQRQTAAAVLCTCMCKQTKALCKTVHSASSSSLCAFDTQHKAIVKRPSFYFVLSLSCCEFTSAFFFHSLFCFFRPSPSSRYHRFVAFCVCLYYRCCQSPLRFFVFIHILYLCVCVFTFACRLRDFVYMYNVLRGKQTKPCIYMNDMIETQHFANTNILNHNFEKKKTKIHMLFV